MGRRSASVTPNSSSNSLRLAPSSSAAAAAADDDPATAAAAAAAPAAASARLLLSKMRPTRADLIALLLLVVVAAITEKVGTPRVQPASLDDPALQKPKLPDIVPTHDLLLGAFVLPPLYLAALHVPFGGGAALSALAPALAPFACGLIEANAVTLALTNVLKLLVGRPRPFFAAACVAYDPPNSTACTGPPALVADARKSFPSGHSGLSFAAATYSALVAARRLGLADPRVASKTARLLVVWVPLVVAALVAASRVIDYHHHYSDIVGGTLLGAGAGTLAFMARGASISPPNPAAAAVPLAPVYSTVESGAEVV